MKWNKFSESLPKEAPYFVSDFKEVWLALYQPINLHDNEVCAECKIDLPEVPKKEKHCCERKYIRCEENDLGFLQIFSIKSIFEQHPHRQSTMLLPIKVECCPFCKFTLDKK